MRMRYKYSQPSVSRGAEPTDTEGQLQGACAFTDFGIRGGPGSNLHPPPPPTDTEGWLMTIQVLLGMSLSKGDESLPAKFVKRNTISMFSISQLTFLIFLIKKK